MKRLLCWTARSMAWAESTVCWPLPWYSVPLDRWIRTAGSALRTAGEGGGYRFRNRHMGRVRRRLNTVCRLSVTAEASDSYAFPLPIRR